MASGPGKANASRLIAGDAALGYLLFNELRHRAVERVFGVSRRESNVLSVWAAGALAVGTVAGAARLRRTLVRRPSVADTAIGATLLKETAHGIAGDWSRKTPFFAALLTLVILEKSFGPSLRGVWRALRETERGAKRTLHGLRTMLEGEQ